jgi:hypothetical protein
MVGEVDLFYVFASKLIMLYLSGINKALVCCEVNLQPV